MLSLIVYNKIVYTVKCRPIKYNNCKYNEFNPKMGITAEKITHLNHA